MDLYSKYAIFETGGKQYYAFEGRTIGIEKLDAKEGDKVSFSQVLLKRRGDGLEVGKPYLTSPVKAVVIKQTKGPKIIALKFKRRKKYKRKIGHRQPITVIRIEAI